MKKKHKIYKLLDYIYNEGTKHTKVYPAARALKCKAFEEQHRASVARHPVLARWATMLKTTKAYKLWISRRQFRPDRLDNC